MNGKAKNHGLGCAGNTPRLPTVWRYGEQGLTPVASYSFYCQPYYIRAYRVQATGNHADFRCENPQV